MKNVLKKAILVVSRKAIAVLEYISTDVYMIAYTWYLRRIGINISGHPRYISSSVYFDGADYSKIHLGDNVTISREVMFLTHDYSITTALASIGKMIPRGPGEVFILDDIVIGRNCFIGARASVLPGARVGDNVVIGAGSVVKGNIADGSIVAGNPARTIALTAEWVEKKMLSGKYIVQ
ncbi:acyltransferase [Mesorhizobium delmotii]|uniref:Bacterial transferase hexapeptide family protein n=1 Tax=Mesorhizobium delmotii TaxID=1631247 RepID=A0A2P9AF21_9HYPH|nr:acyltransferase [Mesorhizobium delmotii]SJM29740.1 Bacterial transferase hexapeptide family protein [Mesorhizobium delmotii]